MKHMKNTSLLAGFLAGVAVLSVGCSKQADQFDQGWTPPVKVADSIDNLVSGLHLCKFRNTIMGIQSLGKGTNKCFFLNKTNDSWNELPLIIVPEGYGTWGTTDQEKGRILFDGSDFDNEHLVAKFITETLMDDNRFQSVEGQLTKDKKTLFETTDKNVQLDSLWVGRGFISDSNIYSPYCLDGKTYRERGPFNTGVFCSTNSGATWFTEQISSQFNAFYPLVCKSEGFYYYFGTRIVSEHGYQLWFSRKPVNGSSWDEPKTVTKTFATTNERYDAMANNGTVHVCWMDCRDDMRRFSMEGPNIENDDIAYCHRKDSDADWSQDVILSKGLLYSYLPSISIVENNIVVAWAGIRTADKNHTEYDSNDIYYVTSRDGGETWSKPLMVTDKSKDGITSGKPQVMLLNGVIHLFYIQGTMGNSKQLSPGLTKLNQAPWPIYYTQRQFPD